MNEDICIQTCVGRIFIADACHNCAVVTTGDDEFLAIAKLCAYYGTDIVFMAGIYNSESPSAGLGIEDPAARSAISGR